MPIITGSDGFEFEEVVIEFDGDEHFDFYSVEVREECRCWAPYSFLIGGEEPSVRVQIKNTGEHLVSISGYVADGQIYSESVDLRFSGRDVDATAIHKNLNAKSDVLVGGNLMVSGDISFFGDMHIDGQSVPDYIATEVQNANIAADQVTPAEIETAKREAIKYGIIFG